MLIFDVIFLVILGVFCAAVLMFLLWIIIKEASRITDVGWVLIAILMLFSTISLDWTIEKAEKAISIIQSQ